MLQQLHHRVELLNLLTKTTTGKYRVIPMVEMGLLRAYHRGINSLYGFYQENNFIS